MKLLLFAPDQFLELEDASPGDLLRILGLLPVLLDRRRRTVRDAALRVQERLHVPCCIESLGKSEAGQVTPLL
jgi:hypothetical protein